MFFLKRYIYLILIIFLLGLLVSGYVLNKYSSASKKNEISNFAQQLKTRNSQLSKIQKNLKPIERGVLLPGAPDPVYLINKVN